MSGARVLPSPRIEFPADLPITAHVEEIAGLLKAHPVIVVAGETGSGKTTQLPKICLAAGFGADAMIGHTQPRRLAARAVAARVAEELGVPLGGMVGYAVRFSDVVSADTRVKVLTDGLLLTEIRRDKRLSRYDVVIIDEAHERSLNIDFLLGYLEGLLAKRPDLRLIITSATIDVAAFSRHFADAPVVEVSGRSYPVTVRYLDEELAADSFEARFLEVLEQIEQGPQSAARDVLAFFPGEREIMEAARLLRGAFADRFDVLPLYARLSAAEQQKVFQPGRRRRIVLATNVAETSLTVPNIGYVIDSGTARISRYSYRSKLERLSLEPVSQASANQRAGRCGRIAPGVCFRLYTQADFESRPAFTDPEIRRSNLASVVLQMRAFGLGDPSRFPFLDPPDPRAIRDAETLLDELGALDTGGLTEIGRAMARLPVDPRLARMLLAADRTRALTEMLVIVAALATPDPRERPLEKQGSADRAHAQWVDARSDFLTLLNLWRWFEERRQALSRAELRRELGRNFLSVNRMHEWRALHRQLLLVVRELSLKPNTEPADYASLHRALLSGSLSLIGVHDERGEYLGPRGLKFRIHPGSALAERNPRWVIAGEIVETRRVYARCVAGVEARWIEEAATHLLKRTHNDPHWSSKRGEALVFETVTLYGLKLVERRPVSLARIDPAASRNLFLQDGLVRGALREPPDFLIHNLERMEELRALEDRGRRRDLLLPEAAIAELYDRLLPPDVMTAVALTRWLRRASPEAVDALYLSRDALSGNTELKISEADFPPELTIRDTVFRLRYRFAPGEPDDGVSLEVPMGLLHLLVESQLDWSVPGMLPGVCEQWLRSLPKRLRRTLTPIPESVSRILPVLLQPSVFRQGRLEVALADALHFEFGVQIAAADWDRRRIDPHWLMNVQVLDADGKVVGQGRDLAALQQSFRQAIERRMEGGLKDRHEIGGLREFPESLPASLVIGDPGAEVNVYPALVDEGDSVAVRYLLDCDAQRAANQRGYARLALLALGQTARFLKKQLAGRRGLGLLYAPLGNAQLLEDEILRASAWQCFFEGRELPADAESFRRRVDAHRGALAEHVAVVTDALESVLALRLTLIRELDAAASPAYAETVADIRAQLDRLVPADVLRVTPAAWLAELPRYLEAARFRLKNLQGKVQRDRDQIPILLALGRRIERIRGVVGVAPGLVTELRFELEEVRVGVFAERLGVRGKASPKRLDRRLLELERELGLV